MESLSWALTAAAVLLVFYALRVVMQDRDPDKPGGKAGLGCGFFFLACLLWSLAAHRWVGGWLPAFRLGMGIFLATPAIGALTKPHGSRLFLGVIGLILGIVLAGPVVKDLVVEDPGQAHAQLEQELEQLRGKEQDLAEAVAGWDVERLELVAGLQTGGYANFAEAQQDPAALASLQRLDEVNGLLDLGKQRLDQVRTLIAEGEQQLLAEADAEATEDLLEPIDVKAGATPTEQDLTPVEEYAQQKRLESLFEGLEE